MEGGRIVQCGTPRDIFSNPATDYVAEFVAHMNPLGVLCARDIVEPAEGTPDRTVGPDATIREVMEASQGHDAPGRRGRGWQASGSDHPQSDPGENPRPALLIRRGAAAKGRWLRTSLLTPAVLPRGGAPPPRAS